jgi:hypothetical protein
MRGKRMVSEEETQRLAKLLEQHLEESGRPVGWLVLHVSLHGAQRPATYRVQFDTEPDGAQVMEMLAGTNADGLVLFGQKWERETVRWSEEAYVWIPAHNIRQVVAAFQTTMADDPGVQDAKQSE